VASDLGLEGFCFFFAPSGQFLALDLAWRAEPEILNHEGIVVLLLALLIRPIIGANLCLQYELIALARILCDRLAQTLECDEPETGDDLACISLIVLACIIVADQANPSVRGVAFGSELGILGKIADGG
jgi:hypothetical protein